MFQWVYVSPYLQYSQMYFNFMVHKKVMEIHE